MNALTDEQFATFARDGYLVVPNVVDESLLVAADAEVDKLVADQPPPAGHVGPHFYFPAPERMPRFDATLRVSDALSLAEQLVSPHRLENEFKHVQLAMTFSPWSHIPGGPHIDGHRPDQAEPHSFTVLVGIYLGDETESLNGNLWVWPGSHWTHARLFNENGPNALLASSGHSPPTRAPVPVLAKRGDLLLAHFLLGHNSGGNEQAWTRRMLYFRLSAVGHAGRWQQTFLDPLTEYPRLRDFDLGEQAEVV